MDEKIWFITEGYEYTVGDSLAFLKTSGEKAIYLHLHLNDGNTRQQITTLTDMHARTVERAMKALGDRGVIEGR